MNVAEPSKKHGNVPRVNWSEPSLTDSCVHLTKFFCQEGVTHDAQHPGHSHA